MSLEYKFDNRGTVEVHHTSEFKRSSCWYWFIGTLVLLLAAGGWLFFSGYLTPADGKSGVQALTLRGKMNEQERLIAKQTATITELENQLASAKRDKEVQVAANEELGKKLAVVEEEFTTQRDKLVLYEKILSPEGLEEGVHIQHFGLKKRLVDADGKKAEDQNLYQYHLVLSHIRNDETVKGSYTIAISGKQNGKVVTVTQQDVTPAGESAKSRFAVKHYQSLEGNLLFPKNFEPEAVKLRLKLASGDTPERLSKRYEWSSFNTLDSNNRTNLSASSNKE